MWQFDVIFWTYFLAKTRIRLDCDTGPMKWYKSVLSMHASKVPVLTLIIWKTCITHSLKTNISAKIGLTFMSLKTLTPNINGLIWQTFWQTSNTSGPRKLPHIERQAIWWISWDASSSLVHLDIDHNAKPVHMHLYMMSCICIFIFHMGIGPSG